MRKVILGLLLGAIGLSAAVIAAAPDPAERRAAAHKAMQAGNFKDAYDAFSTLALDDKSDPKLVSGDLRYAVDCLQRLGRTGEADAFREKVVAAHQDNWRLLWQAAMSFHNGTENWGYIVAGQFERGNHRGGAGRHVSSADRDRVRAMQLMNQAMPLALNDAAKGEASQFFFTFADVLLDRRFGGGAWRLQDLTDLAAPLPDYEDMNHGRGYWNGYGDFNGRGAPVNEDGSPLFHKIPKSWEDAKSDGERLRWCFLQAAELEHTSASRARFEFAQFLQSQFDVTTMLYGYGRYVPYLSADPDGADDDTKQNETGPFAVSTLSEDETIARLAGGTKRFKLPDEFNFIKLFKDVLESNSGYATQAASALGQIFEDRQQYPRAAEFWRAGIELNDGNLASFRQRLNQIVGNWCMFEGARTLPAGVEPKLPLLFRNGTKVTFEAREIDVAKFLADLKAYFKSSPNQLDWQLTQPDDVGRRIIQLGQDQYVGKQVAQWEMPLKPREKHFDRRIIVQTPLKKAGAYLLTATMDGGNVNRLVVWVADTTIVKKTMVGGSYYFVADAATGKPIPNAKLDFFGWVQHHLGDNKYKVETSEFTAQAGPDGQLMLTPEQQSSRFQWLVTATAEGGRFAHHGYTSVWAHPANVYERQYNERKVFAITDRPVYRPGQTVKFKFWLNEAKYDAKGRSPFAGQSITARIFNPKGDKVLETTYVADAFGGISGELPLEKEATLGVYTMQAIDRGEGSFRVEEYKKPEFEVTVEAPTEPVMLGEKITATIKSKYYFGTPVTSAKVKYKVLRSEHDAQWFPEAAWDWFYGKGYWWFGQDYDWYPGWRHWGCFAPTPWWWQRPQAQPEVVSENEVAVGPDGIVKVEIDTALAKAIHADSDHHYEITAEVTDQSRRTITGTGTVSVARKPFKVYTWVDRGYYRAGDVIRAEFAAQTLDQKPVKGAGELKLLAISYDADLKPTERVVETWQLGTDDRGRAAQAIKAAQPGQYRLSYTVTDEKKHAIEGGYVFVVRNEGFDGSAFRFNDVEMVADKREYQPGDKVRLMINTSRPDSTVVLCVRPTNGVYLPPKLIRMNGKSTVEEIEVAQRDMPNFFVEAFTVADGKVYEQTKELVVPPESRVLNVEVLPDVQRYKPGQRAKVKIRVTDAHGEPVVGSAVVSLYDKSVEYISGGTNVREIREAFWKWRRTHQPRTETNLSRRTYYMLKPGEEGFGYLGRFGQLVSNLPLGDADFFALGERQEGKAEGFFLAGGGGGFGSSLRAFGGVPAAAAAPMGRMSGFRKGVAQGGAMEFDALEMAKDKSGFDGAGGPPELVQPTVRKNFADTALWLASLDVKDDGVAEVELDMPENLTTWKARVWVMSDGTRVGQGTAEVVTAKDLIVRLQVPRFFVQKDEVVLSANVHNYLATTKDVTVSLELDGGTLTPTGDLTQVVQISATGEKRVDWRVKVNSPGTATVRVLAKTDEESDAMQLSFPVYVHGMLKTDSFSGGIRPGDSSASLTYRIPEERIPEHSRVEIRYSPSVASSMVDALPYLVDYPYGCTEQTLNRFVPTVITQRVLLGMGLDLKDIRDKRANLNAQEVGDDAKRAADWKRNNPPNPGVPERNPVFDEAEVKAMVLAGVTKLSNQQLSDGGWGWFSGFGEHSTPHTTATVLHGLQVARANDASVPANVIDRGVAWLKTYEAEQVRRLNNWPTKTDPYKRYADNLDAFVFMVLSDEKQMNAEMRDFLFRDRNELSVYCLAQLGLAFQQQDGQADKLAMVLKNLSQYVVKDDENQTAYLQLPGSQSYWWYWYGSDTEANAYYLKLLARTDGKGPVAAGLAKYMINNRRHASYWNSTRDTALCIEALAEFIKASGESTPDMTVVVSIDGKAVKKVPINAANFFNFDNKLVIDGLAVTPGEHRVEFTRTGSGPLYFNAYVTNFTLEDPIKKAGLEIKVQRQFYRLVPVEKTAKVSGSRGQSVDQKVEAHRREPIKAGDVLTSGDLVEVELEIDSKNDYEYVLFEDMKASGFEPVDTQSGYNGNDLNAYMELRDERVCFFARTLARGKNSVAYHLRAEIPGTFHALPTKASAMYAPELKANSDEAKLAITDAKVTELQAR